LFWKQSYGFGSVVPNRSVIFKRKKRCLAALTHNFQQNLSLRLEVVVGPSPDFSGGDSGHAKALLFR
jgi:hypothetical protein